ncbi:MAG: hypothetical protein AAGC81_00065 [Pseudomonadota bacterium]
MSDVMKIALERRSQLTAELARIDEFIRMAESLVQEGSPLALGPAPENTAIPAREAEPVSQPVEQLAPKAAAPSPEPTEEKPARGGHRPMVFRQKSAS